MRWRWRKKRERELERELRSDFELEAAEQQENGLPPDAAFYAAHRALGNLGLVKEEGAAGVGLDVPGPSEAGTGLRTTRNAQKPRIQRHRSSVAGPRHRRKYRHL